MLGNKHLQFVGASTKREMVTEWSGASRSILLYGCAKDIGSAPGTATPTQVGSALLAHS